MKIACLQFAPAIGEVDDNISLADAILARADPQNLDLLVLPELAFTGYNFRSLQHISPFFESSAEGISSIWARNVALKYGCYVTVGYPEEVDISARWPADPEYYNASITMDPEGEIALQYRKTHLYYTDETWALEGRAFGSEKFKDLGTVATGICMDINPYKFEAPWSDYEFSNHVLRCNANLASDEPDLETLSYWLARLEPIIRADTQDEIIVVLANRCGVEEEAVYAGTSTVLGIHMGEVNLYGMLGRGTQDLLVVDTSLPAKARIVSEMHLAESNVSASSNESIRTQDTHQTTPGLDEEFESDEIVTPIEGSEPTSPFLWNRRSVTSNFLPSGSHLTDFEESDSAISGALPGSEPGSEGPSALRHPSNSRRTSRRNSQLASPIAEQRPRRVSLRIDSESKPHVETAGPPTAPLVSDSSSSRRRRERLAAEQEESAGRPKSNVW